MVTVWSIAVASNVSLVVARNLFPPIGQWIHLGIVEQRVLTIAPGEAARANAQVLVGDELWSRVVIVVFHLHDVGVHTGQPDGGDAHEVEDFLPKIGIGLVVSGR